ncbi:alpha/beta hydrolase [Nocardiopsis sp. NRRL B-16309]|uniref:alpha/beta hydrolase n=1 Tax=Nocardiopsis sp. NRRL B-16309 TaxID=1519494 RepID=UPI0006AD854D|nr:alpha/beta fold hydrolase [Nocardiopsis sp. NRRL B-16309]KOX15403.1 lysophospholipase [Nocardiopsis sp. NRRL B-16309]
MDDHDPYTAHMPASLRPNPRPARVSTWWRRPGAEVHVERVGDPRARHRIVLLHGAGGHAGLLWPYAAAVAARGAHVVVPDLPGYGRTRVRRPGAVRYADWVRLTADLLRAERADHDGPLSAVGASLGGMLAFDAVTRTGAADRVVATCLLDPRDPAALRCMSRFPWAGGAAVALLRALAGPLAGIRIPIRWPAKMRAMSNRPALTRAVAADPRGGGTRVPLGFLRDYLESAPAVEPEQAASVPVVLAHPALDRWTPPAVSRAFLDRIAAPTRYVPLVGCGHLPVEEPGVSTLVDLLADTPTR